MANLLIRDLSSEVLAEIDFNAARLGLSRAKFVRRRLIQESGNQSHSVTESHLKEILKTLPDLADEKIMAQAWR